MPSRNPLQRLADISENIQRIGEFVAGLSFDGFVSDAKTLYAVERALLVIFEAVRKLPNELIARHPDVNWKAAAGIGNKLRHDYDSVDAMIIWQTIDKHLPVLQKAVVHELARLTPSER